MKFSINASIRNVQQAVVAWKDSFLTGTEFDTTPKIGAFRIMEEAAEACQAADLSEEEAIRTIRYVYSRPVGELRQELAQVLVNLVWMAHVMGFSLQDEVLREIERIDTPEMKAKIYAKQKSKRDAGLA